MRQIKFRAWAYASRVMFYPDDDGLIISNGNISPLPNTTIMQFTGLNDKNGKEIYEGDIIIGHGHNAIFPLKYVVVFNEKEFGYRLRWEAYYKEKNDGFYDKKLFVEEYKVFEVVGNIYETPLGKQANSNANGIIL